MRMFIKVCAVVMLCGLQSGVQAATATAWNALYQTTQNLLQNQGDRAIVADNIKKLRANAAKLGGQTYLNKVRRLEAMLDVRTLIEQGNIAQAEKSIKLYGGQKELKPIVPQLQKEVQIARKEVARETITEMQRRRKEPVALPEKPVAEKPASLLMPPVVVMPSDRAMPVATPPVPASIPSRPVVATTTVQRPQEAILKEIRLKLENWAKLNKANDEKLDSIEQIMQAYLNGLEATTKIGTLTDSEAQKMLIGLMSGIYERREKSIPEIDAFIATYCDKVRQDWIKSGKLLEKEAEVEPLQRERRVPRPVEQQQQQEETPESIQQKFESWKKSEKEKVEAIEKLIQENFGRAYYEANKDTYHKAGYSVYYYIKALTDLMAAVYQRKDEPLSTIESFINNYCAEALARGIFKEGREESLSIDQRKRFSPEVPTPPVIQQSSVPQLEITPQKTPEATPQSENEQAYLDFIDNLRSIVSKLEGKKQRLEEVRKQVTGAISAEKISEYTTILELYSGKEDHIKASQIRKAIAGLKPQDQQANELFQQIEKLNGEIIHLMQTVTQELNKKGQELTPGAEINAPPVPQEIAPSAMTEDQIMQKIKHVLSNKALDKIAAMSRAAFALTQETSKQEIEEWKERMTQLIVQIRKKIHEVQVWSSQLQAEDNKRNAQQLFDQAMPVFNRFFEVPAHIENILRTKAQPAPSVPQVLQGPSAPPAPVAPIAPAVSEAAPITQVPVGGA